MVDRVGQQLGNYRLSRLIGRGGFADVYLGEHIHLNTQAAIKVLQMQLTGSNLEQFRNEARTIASLASQHRACAGLWRGGWHPFFGDGLCPQWHTAPTPP